MKLDNLLFILFGATGDLARKKLFPALLMLQVHNNFPKKFMIIGTGRKPFTNDTFRKYVKKILKDFVKSKHISIKKFNKFINKIHFIRLDVLKQDDYQKLIEFVNSFEKKNKIKANLLFYLSIEPGLFGETVARLKHAKLTQGEGWRRIVIEKPFGYDLKSAKKLQTILHKTFKEDQIYHLDHYLGKEMIQNIFAIRFANFIFDRIWNSEFIDHVQITDSETLGIEGRISYYDKAGALRDIVQNHLMQILSLIAMDRPKSLQPEDIRKEKIKIFRSIHINPENVVRGQYDNGFIGKNKVPGYTAEIGKKSNTETYVALKLEIKNSRWKGIPFYLRTGKRLANDLDEVNIIFKSHAFFNLKIQPDILTIRIKPDEGMKLKLNTKKPGSNDIQQVEMDYCHSCLFSPKTPEAYERLILDVINGDRTLFVSWNEIELTWKLIDKIQKHWKDVNPKLLTYPAGSLGPKEADKLIEKDGRKWINPSL